ncbi:hypothetical protein [Polaromonas sp.]|uniref:hypothetical protein n=1 Tax=Polaromonas sp. TaxID=1869339 RepID=UPI00286A7164|nr:hypothetical protein [Polaromonas sp.]
MKTMHRPVLPALRASVITALALVLGMPGWGNSAAADPVLENTVVAAVVGAVGGSGGAAEAVVFTGQASISGKVVHDTVFGAPPVLEIIVDLGNIRGKGLRSGKTYLVSSQAILHRPLLAFDPVELSFPFVADGNLLLARSATASFGVYYSAARGMTTTPVRISPNRPG